MTCDSYRYVEYRGAPDDGRLHPPQPVLAVARLERVRPDESIKQESSPTPRGRPLGFVNGGGYDIVRCQSGTFVEVMVGRELRGEVPAPLRLVSFLPTRTKNLDANLPR